MSETIVQTVHHTCCPLCQSSQVSSWMKTVDFMLTREAFEIWRCQDCGFRFTQNAPDADEMGKYYQSREYISHSDIRKGLMNRLYHLGRTMMLQRKWQMIRKIKSKGKLLDVGCGTGYFADYMNRKGYDVTGVEADPKAKAFAEKEFGLEVFSPEDFQEKKLTGPFDVITLWHVLEHLHDFHLSMERIRKHLAPGGVLVIALPNGNAYDARHYKEFWAGYDVPRHLWHFTPQTFQLLAEKHGFSILKMKRLPLDPFYNSMLSEKYKGNRFSMISGMVIGKMAYLEGLAEKRKTSSVVYILQQNTGTSTELKC
ncbi:MAG: class I SAM-dependent methyltransferase [Bacteroidales bacterium]|nr:class I SAM-dependent methyltransferase [Bacteroidales bacterium]